MTDTLDGVISRILYHDVAKWNPAGTPFLIAKLTNGSVVKGEMRRPKEYENYRFYGEWRPQKGRSEPAFEFSSHEVLVDQSVPGMVQYLKTYVDGIGPIKATALAETFGVDTLRTLRTKPELARQVGGISEADVESIRRHFEEEAEFDPAAYARLFDLFATHKVPKKIVKLLLRDFGSDAPEKLLENPYMLLAYPRMGWKTVDSFALAVAKYDPAGIGRHKAAIVESLENLANDGHTYGSRTDIEAIAYTLIGAVPAMPAWAALIEQDDVFVNSDEPLAFPDCLRATFSLPKLAAAEREIARRLALLAESARPLDFALESDRLNDDQRAALKIIEDNGVSALVGPPGVGKTWTITSIIQCLVSAGIYSIRVVTPTGKAAKRAAELLGKAGLDPDLIPSTTIHRALGPKPSDAPEGVPSADAKIGRGREGFSFSHNEDYPLDVDFIVIDETSMVDVSLGASLLRALAPGTRVVFVGDHNQLPSVGPGSVLRDMMDAGIPTAMLSKIVRSDGGGRVVRACHAIKDGHPPEPAECIAPPTENWVHLEESDPNKIARMIVELHESARSNGRFDPVWDMQVVTPQKTRLPIACDNLNAMLSALLNPNAARPGAGGMGGGDGESGKDQPGFRPPFVVGDKVVRTKNGLCDEMVPIGQEIGRKDGVTGGDNHSFDPDSFDSDSHEDWTWRGKGWELRETDIVNGDMGTVLDIVPDDKGAWVVVRFNAPERLCRLPYNECHLIQAYAMTVHKCQGSGFRYVIVPVHHSFYWDQKTQTGLWNRELIYTAISRTEEYLITVGQFSAIRAAVQRKTVNRRRTKLVELIRERSGERSDTQLQSPVPSEA